MCIRDRSKYLEPSNRSMLGQIEIDVPRLAHSVRIEVLRGDDPTAPFVPDAYPSASDRVAMRAHGTQLTSRGTRLTNHGPQMPCQHAPLASHNTQLANHDTQLASHGTQLVSHGT
eukprot:TRINITY_DN25685_c0_g1_i4.p2 TRINITY_DN25685_c0_g1~~TRINITY_DN25685_c0_g1_i4.p2  ORF type:complete len:115 (+),score=11.27 TRINITY_DN25685_c0_g1_i4:126-470(+)